MFVQDSVLDYQEYLKQEKEKQAALQAAAEAPQEAKKVHLSSHHAVISSLLPQT
jgi:hypothetical protein